MEKETTKKNNLGSIGGGMGKTPRLMLRFSFCSLVVKGMTEFGPFGFLPLHALITEKEYTSISKKRKKKTALSKAALKAPVL